MHVKHNNIGIEYKVSFQYMLAVVMYVIGRIYIYLQWHICHWRDSVCKYFIYGCCNCIHENEVNTFFFCFCTKILVLRLSYSHKIN